MKSASKLVCQKNSCLRRIKFSLAVCTAGAMPVTVSEHARRGRCPTLSLSTTSVISLNSARPQVDLKSASYLTPEMSLRDTVKELRNVEREPVSRFTAGSPCRFIRSLDVLVHVVVPEALENLAPDIARYLRSTSPRWGRSWRHW